MDHTFLPIEKNYPQDPGWNFGAQLGFLQKDRLQPKTEKTRVYKGVPVEVELQSHRIDIKDGTNS